MKGGDFIDEIRYDKIETLFPKFYIYEEVAGYNIRTTS